MRLTLLLSLVLSLYYLAPCHALPKVRTYRGQSRYSAMYLEEKAVPAIPNPKVDPEFYAHRYTEEYVRQGFGPERPDWADKIIRAFQTIVKGIKLDMVILSKVTSPYFSGKSEDVQALSRFKFNPDGDYDFLQLKHGASRFDLEGNETTAALPSLPEDSGFDYTNDKVRGVNIGNWVRILSNRVLSSNTRCL